MKSRQWRVTETIIPKLAAEYGALAQNPTEDESGWDIQLEFPPESRAIYPDRNIHLPSAYLQIKSTSSMHAHCRVKLSNLLRMACSTQPWFLVLYQYTDAKKPRLYIRHIWKEEIYYILENVRKAHQLDKPLNKSSMTFKFHEYFNIDTSLIRYMHEVLRSFGDKYNDKKAHLVRTIGYEEGYAQVQLKVCAADTEAFKENFTGYGDGLDFKSFELYDSRFGLVGSEPHLQIYSGKVHIQPEPLSGFEILITGENSRDSVSFEADAYISPLNSPEEDSIFFRLSSSPLELFYQTGGKGELKFDLDEYTEYSLNQIAKFSILNRIISREACDVQIWKDGERLIGAKFSENIRLWDWDWWLFSNAICSLLQCIGQSQIDEKLVNFNDIFRAQREMILFYQACEDKGLVIEFGDLETLGDQKQDANGPRICLYHLSVSISRTRFNCLIKRSVVHTRRHENHVRVELGEPIVLFRYTDNPTSFDDQGRSTIKKDYDRILRDLADTEHVLALGDFGKILATEGT